MGLMTSTAGLVKMKLIKQQNWKERERVVRGCSFQMINLLTWHHTSRISDTIQFIHPHGLMFSLPLYPQTARSHKPLDLYDSIRKHHRELWVIVCPRIFTQKIARWSHDLIHHSFTLYLECFFHLRLLLLFESRKNQNWLITFLPQVFWFCFEQFCTLCQRS